MDIEKLKLEAQSKALHIADVSGSALFNADCMYILPLIPDKSVQLILADLPYGTTACKWDSIIPLDPLCKEYKRIIKDNGAIVLTASQPFTTKLISSNYEMFKYEWIWNKINGSNFMNLKNRPFKTQENICVFSKTPNIIFNPQRIYRTEKSLKRDKIGSEANRNLFATNVEHYNCKRSTKLKLASDGKKHPIDINNKKKENENVFFRF